MDKDVEDVYTHTHTLKYYSTIKKNEILSFATMWMTLKGIILSEVSQTKTNILVLTEIRNIKMKQKVNITKQKQM